MQLIEVVKLTLLSVTLAETSYAYVSGRTGE